MVNTPSDIKARWYREVKGLGWLYATHPDSKNIISVFEEDTFENMEFKIRLYPRGLLRKAKKTDFIKYYHRFIAAGVDIPLGKLIGLGASRFVFEHPVYPKTRVLKVDLYAFDRIKSDNIHMQNLTEFNTYKVFKSNKDAQACGLLHFVAKSFNLTGDNGFMLEQERIKGKKVRMDSKDWKKIVNFTSDFQSALTNFVGHNAFGGLDLHNDNVLMTRNGGFKIVDYGFNQTLTRQGKR